jgi:hypothetical protein
MKIKITRLSITNKITKYQPIITLDGGIISKNIYIEKHLHSKKGEEKVIIIIYITTVIMT